MTTLIAPEINAPDTDASAPSSGTGNVTPGRIPTLDLAKLGPEVAVHRLVDYAILLPASDLFIASNENEVEVSVRHLGVIQPIAHLTSEVGRKLILHLKAAAGMDHQEKRRPQDGRWIYTGDGLATIDLRVSIIPTLHGEDIALRILSRDRNLFTLDNIGMTDGQLVRFESMLSGPSGLILITGPTGSGKTATLYAGLQRLNNGFRKINTIEDPIEFSIAGVRQSQVNPALDLGFNDLLKSVLRQSPDVIMVGEIRDDETADIAVRAANSGSLVLATIHSPVASAAVHSLRSLGVHPHFIANSLRGVVSQRLIRTLCPQCKVVIDLSESPATFDEVRPWLTPDEGRTLCAARGCPACQMLGYQGRTGVFEVLPATQSIRSLIADGATTRAIREQALIDGMLEFRLSALLKVARGITSTEEVFRVIPPEHLLQED